MLGLAPWGALPSNDPIRRGGTTRPMVRSIGSLVKRALLRWERLQRVAKRRSGRDTELGEGPVEVTANGPVGQEQPFRDLFVRHARSRERHYLEFLRGESVENVVARMRLRASRRAQLGSCPLHPRSGAEALEYRQRGVELDTRLDHRAYAP